MRKRVKDRCKIIDKKGKICDEAVRGELQNGTPCCLRHLRQEWDKLCKLKPLESRAIRDPDDLLEAFLEQEKFERENHEDFNAYVEWYDA